MSSIKGKSGKSQASKFVPQKVKPIVVKHVLTQEFLKKPETFQNRPQKIMQDVGDSSVKYSPSSHGRSGTFAPPSGKRLAFQNSQSKLKDPPISTQNPSSIINLQQITNERGIMIQQNQAVTPIGYASNPINSFGQIQNNFQGLSPMPVGIMMNSSGLSDAVYHNTVSQNTNLYHGQPNPSGVNTPSENRAEGRQQVQDTIQAGKSIFLSNAHQQYGLSNQNLNSASKASFGISEQSHISPRLIASNPINSLMQQFQPFDKNQGQTKVIRVVDEQTGVSRLEVQHLSMNFEEQSIKSGVSQRWSAIGEMNPDELNQMTEENKKKIKKIEEKYFFNNSQIQTAKQIMQEQQATFSIKEKFKDSSIKYPSYGRGLKPPGIELNTFMIKEKKVKKASDSNSPKVSSQAEQRQRILSPKRQRFETRFEKFMKKKIVEDKLNQDPGMKIDFDTTTKPQGTLNAKVNKKQKFLKEEQARKQKEAMLKSLNVLEKDAENLVQTESYIVMSNEFLNRLQEVFQNSKERGKEDLDEVETNELICSVAEHPYFEEWMNKHVRISVDNHMETLESLLHRVLKTYKSENIKFQTFLGFFSKRGRLREGEEPKIMSKQEAEQLQTNFEQHSFMSMATEESFDTKERNLTKVYKQVLANKQERVPKTGKGKFNVTVPQPFDFLDEQKQVSIRAQKVDQMIREKKLEEEKALKFKYKAKEIPKAVKSNKYEKLMKEMEQRRMEAKKLAVAKIKATEAPFNFYERDKEDQMKKKQQVELPPQFGQSSPFRAREIPYKVLIPLYKQMVDEAVHERKKRIKRNSEVALSLSKLPPRMEADAKKREEEKLQTEKQQKKEEFRPPTPKVVPDFKRLHKEFARKLQQTKSVSRLTNPKPFHFHEGKNDVSLRKHLDAENQVINPTKRCCSVKLNRDIFSPPAINPSTTKKHDAMVEVRRQKQYEKMENKAQEQQEKLIRDIKQVRLASRVKQSPLFVNNNDEMKERRAESLQRYRDQTAYLENVWNQQKAIIDYNVANRPLLFEQQSQKFQNIQNQPNFYPGGVPQMLQGQIINNQDEGVMMDHQMQMLQNQQMAMNDQYQYQVTDEQQMGEETEQSPGAAEDGQYEYEENNDQEQQQDEEEEVYELDEEQYQQLYAQMQQQQQNNQDQMLMQDAQEEEGQEDDGQEDEGQEDEVQEDDGQEDDGQEDDGQEDDGQEEDGQEDEEGQEEQEEEDGEEIEQEGEEMEQDEEEEVNEEGQQEYEEDEEEGQQIQLPPGFENMDPQQQQAILEQIYEMYGAEIDQDEDQ